jgi:hypothetical protein
MQLVMTHACVYDQGLTHACVYNGESNLGLLTRLMSHYMPFAAVNLVDKFEIWKVTLVDLSTMWTHICDWLDRTSDSARILKAVHESCLIPLLERQLRWALILSSLWLPHPHYSPCQPYYSPCQPYYSPCHPYYSPCHPYYSPCLRFVHAFPHEDERTDELKSSIVLSVLSAGANVFFNQNM